MAAGKLAEAYVEITTRQGPLDKGLDSARAKLSAFAARAKSISAIPLTITGGVGLGLLSRELLRATEAAADLAETQSKVREVFRGATPAIIAATDKWADQFGLVKKVSLDAAANFGLVTQAAGLSADASAELSLKLVKLASDASSFYNVNFDVALEKIRAGLVGQSEPLTAFGVLLNEDKVKAEALALGLVQSTAALTDQHKVLARASLITKGLATASGDLERTLDGVANQQRKLQGDIENFRTELGERLIPVLADSIKLLNELFAGTGANAKSGIAAAGEWADAWINAFRAINKERSSLGLSTAIGTLDLLQQHTGLGVLDKALGASVGMPGIHRGKSPLEALKDYLAGKLSDRVNAAVGKSGTPAPPAAAAAGLPPGALAPPGGPAREPIELAGPFWNLVMRGLNARAALAQSGRELLGVGAGALAPLFARERPFHSQSFGDLLAAGGSLQAGILSRDNVPKEQLAELKTISQSARETVEQLRAIATRGLGQAAAILRGRE